MASRRSSSCDLEILPRGARVFDHQSHWQLKLQAFDRAFVWHWIPREKKKQKHKRKRFQQATRYESAARVYHVFGHWPLWILLWLYVYIYIQISSNCILLPSSSFAFSECQHALTCQVALATSIATLQSPQGKSRNHMLGPAPLGVFHLLCRDPATNTIAAYQRIITKP